MNAQQEKAAMKVKKAFELAGRVGLTGGVFEGTVCLWPKEINVKIGELEFFETVEEFGIYFCPIGIELDGGTGV